MRHLLVAALAVLIGWKLGSKLTGAQYRGAIRATSIALRDLARSHAGRAELDGALYRISFTLKEVADGGEV